MRALGATVDDMVEGEWNGMACGSEDGLGWEEPADDWMMLFWVSSCLLMFVESLELLATLVCLALTSSAPPSFIIFFFFASASLFFFAASFLFFLFIMSHFEIFRCMA